MTKIFFLSVTQLLILIYNNSDLTNNHFIGNEIIEKSIGFGNVLAIVISWSKNKSILLAIFHGILGWLYVVYYSILNIRK